MADRKSPADEIKDIREGTASDADVSRYIGERGTNVARGSRPQWSSMQARGRKRSDIADSLEKADKAIQSSGGYDPEAAGDKYRKGGRVKGRKGRRGRGRRRARSKSRY